MNRLSPRWKVVILLATLLLLGPQAVKALTKFITAQAEMGTPTNILTDGGANLPGSGNSFAYSNHQHHIDFATSTQNGILSSADWNAFNSGGAGLPSGGQAGQSLMSDGGTGAVWGIPELAYYSGHANEADLAADAGEAYHARYSDNAISASYASNAGDLDLDCVEGELYGRGPGGVAACLSPEELSSTTQPWFTVNSAYTYMYSGYVFRGLGAGPSYHDSVLRWPSTISGYHPPAASYTWTMPNMTGIVQVVNSACPDGQVLTVQSEPADSPYQSVCTSEITADDVDCSECVDASGEVTGTLPVAHGGTGTTATTLALTCGAVMLPYSPMVTYDSENSQFVCSSFVNYENVPGEAILAGAAGGLGTDLPDCPNGSFLRANGTTTWCETLPGQTIYFFHHADMIYDARTDESLLQQVATGDGVTETATVSLAEGEVQIDRYATAASDPGQELLEGGAWTFKIWAKVDSLAGGNSYIKLYVYQHLDGTGTDNLLFSALSPALTTSLSEHWFSSIQAPFDMNTTDRLLVKVVAFTYSAASRTVTWVYEGDNGSHFETPFSTVGIAYPLAGEYGGFGAAQPTCASGEVVTCNGTYCSCTAGGSGQGEAPPTEITEGTTEVTVDQTNLRVTAGSGGAIIRLPACSEAGGTLQKIFKAKLLDANTVRVNVGYNGGLVDGATEIAWARRYEYHEFVCQYANVWDVR